MKAKEKKLVKEIQVDYSIPLLEFMRGNSKEGGLVLKIGQIDKRFRMFSEEFFHQIPDTGSGSITRQVEEFWPVKEGCKNLLAALRVLADREKDEKFHKAYQPADFRTTVEYIRQTDGAVYSEPYPYFKSYFQVGSEIIDLRYGMWPDSMNQRMAGPGMGFGVSNPMISESFDESDVLLVVPRQEDYILLPEDPKEELLPSGESIFRSQIAVRYGNDNYRFVHMLQDFCRTTDLSLAFAMSGPANPNEIQRGEDQKGAVKTEVIEFWYPEGEDPSPWVAALSCRENLPREPGGFWELATPHALISYLQAYPEKIGVNSFITFYKGRFGGEAGMIVGKWENIQTRPGVRFFELPTDDDGDASLLSLPEGCHFLAVLRSH